LHAALEALGISEHNVADIGDAENDHAFLECCRYAVVVASTHPAIKFTADFTTHAERGDGVGDLIEAVPKDGFQNCVSRGTLYRLVAPIGIRSTFRRMVVVCWCQANREAANRRSSPVFWKC
jgi:hypothetical protein